MKNYLKQYHPIVHTLLIGTVFISFTNSMVIPFLAIYFSSTLALSPGTIGIIIGIGPLIAMFGGFIGGTLSDFFGRKKFMILSLFVLGIVFLCYIWFKHPILLTFLSILSGLGSSFFATISKALMGDLTAEEKRFRLFSNRYLAINIGYAIGPMVGVYLGIAGSTVTFLPTAIFNVLFAIILIIFFFTFKVEEEKINEEENISFIQSLQVIHKDKILFIFLIGSIFFTTVHGQMSVPLSQYLTDYIEEGTKIFGILMSINGLTVILTQPIITRWAEKYTLFRRLAFGGILFAVGE